MRNEPHIEKVKLARASIIGFYRSGATIKEMAEISGYNILIVAEIIESYIQARETGTPAHQSETGDHFNKIDHF